MAGVKRRSHFVPHDRVRERGELVNPHTGEVVVPVSMTKQEFAKECDINNILKQYSRTGMLNHVSARAASGAYLDLPDSLDFQESVHTVMAAEAAFGSLPSKLRERFNHEPGEFLAFCADPANLAEMRELGLAVPLPQAPPESPDEVPDQAPPPVPPKA